MSQNRKDSSLRAVFRKLTGVIQDYFKGEVSVDTAIRQVTELLSVHLQVPRVSIWVMANDIEGRRIDQLDLYQAKNSTHSSGARILEKDYPRYFQTIDKDMILPIRDARRDRRTSEFRDSYLKPSGIFSLMDGPIHVHGKVAGVICCEQTGTYREWTDAEEEVLLSACTKVSSLLSLRSLEAEVRARS